MRRQTKKIICVAEIVFIFPINHLKSPQIYLTISLVVLSWSPVPSGVQEADVDLVQPHKESDFTRGLVEIQSNMDIMMKNEHDGITSHSGKQDC